MSSLIEREIQCDVCKEFFSYEVDRDAKIESTDILPDGYLVSGDWICDNCGSCSNCGKSLEKTGNQFERKDKKFCTECKEIKN